jgi:hypothetical protein
MSEIENNFEAQQLNEYYDWQPVSDCIDDPEEIRWTPVAKKYIEENEDVDTNFFMFMRKKNERL